MPLANVRTLTWSCYLAMLFLGFGLALIGAAAHNIGLDARQIGLLISAQHLGFVVTVLIAGALADRVAKQKLLTAGSLALGVAFLAFYRADSFEFNLGVMALSGIGVGLYEGATDALLLDLHERDQGRYISLNHMFVTLGSAAIALFMLFFAAWWRPAVGLAGAGALFLGVVFHRARSPVQARPTAPFWPQLLAMPNKALLAALFGMMTLAVGVELGTLGYLSTFLIEARAFTPAMSKIGLLLFLGGIATGRLGAGLATPRGRIGSAVAVMLALTTASAATLYFLDWKPAALPLSFLIGLAVSATAPLLISLAGMAGKQCAGAAIGSIKVAIPAGGMLLPFVVSQIAAQAGWPPSSQYIPFPLVSLIALLAALSLRSHLDRVMKK